MELGSIDRELYVDASPDVVFEVLTSPEYIRDWWSAYTDGAMVPGSSSAFTWTDQSSGAQESSPFTVMESDPPRTFSFRWSYDEGVAAAPGNSLLVTFELIPAGEGTTVVFTETGYRELGWEAARLEAMYEDHRQGWDFYLPRMASTASAHASAR